MTDRENSRFYSVRPRRVPPEFCSDERLEDCTILAALLLYRIISQADDQGRLPGHPKYIKAITFAMREDVTVRKVELAIDELVSAGFLIRYEADGRTYLQVHGWHDLQGKWGRRGYPSRYPAPVGWTADWVTAGKGSADEPDPTVAPTQLRADSAHDASKLHPPGVNPVTGLFSPSPVSVLGSPAPPLRPAGSNAEPPSRGNGRPTSAPPDDSDVIASLQAMTGTSEPIVRDMASASPLADAAIAAGGVVAAFAQKTTGSRSSRSSRTGSS